MEFEFDKEIDAILRKARESEFVFAGNPKSQISNSEPVHPDADEISAFAENALPEKAKQLYTAHFADCDRCRRILSNLIALSSEAKTISVTNVSTEIAAAAASIPWYRKLFAMPNLAYTMGAFILVFGGFLGVLVFQNVEKSESSLSQATEPMSKQSGPSFNQNSDFSSSDALSNANANAGNAMAGNAMTTAANTAANTSNSATSNMAANTASQSYSSNAAAVAREETSSDKTEKAKNAPVILSATPPPADTKPEAQTRDDAEMRYETGDVMVAAAPPPPPAPATGQAANPKKSAQNREDSAEKLRATRAAPASSRKIGGKTFRRINSAWVDGDYREGMPLTRIARGSDDYKKLDREVKNAAENLDGLVIVVWKSKGYRIQ